MIDRLIERIEELQNPTVVGLDPKLPMIPENLKEEAFETYGQTPKAVAAMFYQFNKAIIDQVADIVPAVKPQIAMYESYGPDGVKVFADTVAYAKQKGLIVIGDVKRSDIGSTSAAYATAHLGAVEIGSQTYFPFNEDFATVNPYLGTDSIDPYFETMKRYDRGLFVLVKTSNPGSGELQDQVFEKTGLTLYETVGALVSKWGEDFRGKYGYSDIGAVVGATHPEQGTRLRKQLPHVFFLVPGYGAQGGTAQGLKGCFDKDGRGAIVNSSRGIIAAWQNKYKDRFKPEEFALAARQAALDMKQDLISVL